MKYIHERKQRVIEGQLRCDELSEYLKKLNAPKEVWICEDGSGIISKVSYDSQTNQLIGLVLPTDRTTGMPISFSFVPQSMLEIERQIEESPKSTLVYLVIAQPILDNVPPFVLQVFGTNNTFKSIDVMQRWNHTKNELARYVLSKYYSNLDPSFHEKYIKLNFLKVWHCSGWNIHRRRH